MSYSNVEIKSDWEFVFVDHLGNTYSATFQNTTLSESSIHAKEYADSNNMRIISKRRCLPIERDEPDYYPRRP